MTISAAPTTTTTESAPAPETNSQSTTTPESAAPSLDSQLDAIWEKHQSGKEPDTPEVQPAGRQRDPATGKYISAKPADPADPTKQAQEPAAEEPATEELPSEEQVSDDAPEHWPDDLKKVFSGLDPEAKKSFVAREERISKAFDKVASRAKEYESTLKPIAEAAKKHESFFQKYDNMHPGTVLDRLISAQSRLESAPEQTLAKWASDFNIDPVKLIGGSPIEAIMKIASASGLDLLDIALDPTSAKSSQTAQTAQPSAEVQRLEAMLKEQNEKLARIEAAAREREEAESKKTQQAEQRAFGESRAYVDSFAKQNPDFQVLEPMIARLLPQYMADHPGLTAEQYLKAVYEEARWANPKTREKLLTEQKKTVEDKSKETAKVQKAKVVDIVNARPSSKSANTAGFASLDAELDSIWDKHHRA